MESVCQSHFTVDASLRLTSLDARLGNLLGTRLPEAIGAPYYEFLPRIGHGDVDWIAEAIGSGEAKILRAFRYNCFHGGADADICIAVHKDAEANVTGASVVARWRPTREHSGDMECCRRHVDIGKVSKMFTHSIRNPLHTIKGALCYLQEGYAEGKEVSRFIELAKDEIARIEDLITRLLEVPDSKLVLHEVDINKILKKLEGFIAVQATASNVDFKTSYGEVPLVLVDLFYVELALYNVFINALEAMPQGGKLILETHSGEYMGDKSALIEITDTGRGLSEREIDALLSGQGRAGNGHGNGMLITLDIFRSYGGNVTIESKKGVGTTVLLSIPETSGGGRHEI